MLKLNFNLRHQAITLLNPGTVVATDSKNYLVANFNFISDDWEYPLTAIFTSDVEKIPYAVLVGQSQQLEDNECFIPWEVLQSSGNVYVSVFCGDLHTTNTAKFKVVKSGYTEGEIPPPPTPTIYEQILQALDSKQPMLTAGQNITITEENVISASSGSSDYTDLTNKPSINNITLSGNKSSDDLNLQDKLTAGQNITISDDNVISAEGGGVTSYRQLSDLPELLYTTAESYDQRRLPFRTFLSFSTGLYCSLGDGGIELNVRTEKFFWCEDYEFGRNIDSLGPLKGQSFSLAVISSRLRNCPEIVTNSITSNEKVIFWQIGNGKIEKTAQFIAWKDTDGNSRLIYRQADNLDSTLSGAWIELTGGSSQIVSGVVNANGTITFTDSEGNTFNTSGSNIVTSGNEQISVGYDNGGFYFLFDDGQGA